MTRYSAVITVLIWTILGPMRPEGAAAQSIVLSRDASSRALSDRPAAAEVPVTRPLTGAVVGGAAGFVLGGLTGGYIGGHRCVDPGASDTCDWLHGMAVGTAVGVTLGTPVGAHLFNNRRGALPWSLLTSAAIAGAGVIAIQQVEDDPTGSSRNNKLYAIMIGVPLLQILSSTWIEVHTSRD